MVLEQIRHFRIKVFEKVSIDSYVYFGALVLILILAFVSFSRQALHYGVESDFLGSFVPEAQRFLSQDPLRVGAHPPFYSITLASVYWIIGDWFKSGLILSLLSSLIVIIAVYHFFKLKFGQLEAIGAVMALSFSWVFIGHSLQASSDMFFLALFISALATLAYADKEDKAYCWAISGIFVGLAVITRTNGIALLSCLLFPVLSVGTKISTKKRLMFFLAGMLVPIMTWVVIATIFKSPVFPKSNFQNLAATYFSDDKKNAANADVFMPAGKGFTNSWQVFKKTPKHIFTTYLKDLYQTSKSLFMDSKLIPFPVILFAFPGLILLFLDRFDRFKFCVLIILAGMFFLTNFHVRLDRLYLFAIPFMGAGCIVFFAYLKRILNVNIFSVLLIFLVFSSASGFVDNVRNGYYKLFKRGVASDAVAASQILLKRQITIDTVVIARKPHLGFYTGSKKLFFPNVQTIEELQVSVKSMVSLHPKNTNIYLFYGFGERIYRSQFLMLISSDFSVPWLEKVSSGIENGGWVLYEIIREKLSK